MTAVLRIQSGMQVRARLSGEGSVYKQDDGRWLLVCLSIAIGLSLNQPTTAPQPAPKHLTMFTKSLALLALAASSALASGSTECTKTAWQTSTAYYPGTTTTTHVDGSE